MTGVQTCALPIYAVMAGKAVGKDAALGKATLGTLSGTTAARQQLAEIVATAVGTLSGFGASAEALRDAARFMLSRRK